MFLLIHAHPALVAEYGEAAIKVVGEYRHHLDALEDMYGRQLEECLYQYDMHGDLFADTSSVHAYTVEHYDSIAAARVARMTCIYVFDAIEVQHFQFKDARYLRLQQEYCEIWNGICCEQKSE